MALSRVVSEIVNVEKYRDLEIPVESIKVIIHAEHVVHSAWILF